LCWECCQSSGFCKVKDFSIEARLSPHSIPWASGIAMVTDENFGAFEIPLGNIFGPRVLVIIVFLAQELTSLLDTRLLALYLLFPGVQGQTMRRKVLITLLCIVITMGNTQPQGIA
jgi:hypothetical protein